MYTCRLPKYITARHLVRPLGPLRYELTPANTDFPLGPFLLWLLYNRYSCSAQVSNATHRRSPVIPTKNDKLFGKKNLPQAIFFQIDNCLSRDPKIPLILRFYPFRSRIRVSDLYSYFFLRLT